MGFADWDRNEVADVHKGLLLLGWRADLRSTSDEAAWLSDIATEARELFAAGQLTPDAIDNLSMKAFDVMAFHVMNIYERAASVINAYEQSAFLRSLVPLIDEATLCHYRGYHTSALATLFIVLEHYLRNLAGWRPGMPNPTFANLRAAVKNHPPSPARDEAEAILAVIYAHYDPSSPPQFLFNRHGLLHGLRGPHDVDEMNCVRMFLLFDVLCSAEGVEPVNVIGEEFTHRCAAYKGAVASNAEATLILAR